MRTARPADATGGVRLSDVRAAPPEERERFAEQIAERLHAPVAVLGVIFALVVLGESVADDPAIRRGFQIAGWAMWSVFVVEFAARLVIAPSATRFLRRNWWQVVFLVVPFLRFLAWIRVARAGRVVSSAVRAGRGARATLGSRLAWLGAVTVIVALSGSILAVEFGEFARLGAALHRVALATVAGEPLVARTALGQILEVVLVTYSVVVFAALAGALGAFFLERRGESAQRRDARSLTRRDGGPSAAPG